MIERNPTKYSNYTPVPMYVCVVSAISAYGMCLRSISLTRNEGDDISRLSWSTWWPRLHLMYGWYERILLIVKHRLT